jgi:O-antigen/teichoic acid export membrane protein
MLSVTLPLFFLIFLFSPMILSIYGPEFKDADLILKILAIGQLINVSTGSVGYLLMMSGHEKLLRNAAVLSACVSLVLNLVLIRQLGVVGAAISTAVALSIQNIVAAWLVYRKLGIRVLPGMGIFSGKPKK